MEGKENRRFYIQKFHKTCKVQNFIITNINWLWIYSTFERVLNLFTRAIVKRSYIFFFITVVLSIKYRFILFIYTNIIPSSFTLKFPMTNKHLSYTMYINLTSNHQNGKSRKSCQPINRRFSRSASHAAANVKM